MGFADELAAENAVLNEKLDQIEVEAAKIHKRMTITVGDIKRGRTEVGSQEGSFTGNKLRADYLLFSADELRLKWAEMMRKKPYFCRIDWKEADVDLARYYIGRVGMCNTDDYSPIVVDWRAPIANLYYDGRLGFAEYAAPDGSFTGDLTLKRQLEVADAHVSGFTDIDITTNDTLLQAALSKNADDRLKDIVVTIQGEQNRIIRDKLEGVLVVQGVAGSGKTTILLHRVAYLIYHSEGGKGLKTLIVAPSRLFLTYISNVLPELGVEDIRQDTFVGVLARSLPPKVKVVPSAEPDDVQQAIASFKGSMAFRRILDAYVEGLSTLAVPPGDFVVGNMTLLRNCELVRMFSRDCGYLPLLKRTKEMEKRLKKRAMGVVDRAVATDRSRCEVMLADLRSRGELTTDLAHELYGARDAFAAEAQGQAESDLKRYLATWPAATTLGLYVRLITDGTLLDDLAEGLPERPDWLTKELLADVATHAQGSIGPQNKVTEDDVAGLAYLETLVGTTQQSEGFDQVVVDEGQDLSAFQYFMLRRLASAGSYTIVGDLNQAVNARGVNRWEDLQGETFGGLEVRHQTIRTSYRTTVEIMNLANEVIVRLGGAAELAEPVLRHGDEPMYATFDSLEASSAHIGRLLKQTEAEGFASVGVICRDSDEAKRVYDSLAKRHAKGLKHKPRLLTDLDLEYTAGVSVMPAHLAKGLEFDVAIVADACQYSNAPRDIRLFYVACTRALHRLHINSVGEAEAELMAGNSHCRRAQLLAEA